MKEFIKKTVSMEINFFYKIQKHLITLFFVNSRKKGLFSDTLLLLILFQIHYYDSITFIYYVTKQIEPPN